MSVSSQVTGVDARKDGMSASRDDQETEGVAIDVELIHARWRNLFWGAFSSALAFGLIMVFGPFGWVVGGIFLLVGLSSLWSFVKTLLYAPGHIAVGDGEIKLSPSLCSPSVITLRINDVSHAYLLKRAVPWATSGPVLVVESKHNAWTYPRDWFASESDQRRVLVAINRNLGVL